jgi:hypothetical protein
MRQEPSAVWSEVLPRKEFVYKAAANCYEHSQIVLLVEFRSGKQMKKFLLVAIIGFVLAIVAGNGAPKPWASLAAIAHGECDCSKLEALQIELRNAVGLQQAFQGKIADLRKLDQGPASDEFSRFAAATAKGFKRPPGDTGPEAVEYTPYGNTVDTGILEAENKTTKTAKEKEERREQLCGLSRNAKQEIDDMKRGASCEGIAKAVEAHEGVHWASCRRLGFVAFRDMHGADRAQEEVEAYGAQIKVLRDIIEHLNCGYRASGKFGDTVVSGVVCDLTKPFTINTNNPFIPSFDFVPSSPTSGTWKFSYTNGVAGAGGGGYIIEGTDTLKTGIMLHGSGTATAPIAATSSGTVRINLSKLESSDCGSK